MNTDLRDFADSHGYVRWSYRCDECGYRASGWSDSPMDDDDKCPGCGHEPKGVERDHKRCRCVWKRGDSMIGVAFGYCARSTARDFAMNKCSDELWTIAVALDCHQDGDPKKVMDRVLQRICDYQTVRRLIVAADDASSWSGFDSVQCREAFVVAAKFARQCK